MSKDDFLSTTQAGKLLGISRIAVFKKIRSGELPAVRHGHRYLITPNSLNFYRGLILPEDKEDWCRWVAEKISKDFRVSLEKIGNK
jgi:excisionase family DNA binding protein